MEAQQKLSTPSSYPIREVNVIFRRFARPLNTTGPHQLPPWLLETCTKNIPQSEPLLPQYTDVTVFEILPLINVI
jgi:hypothetical protein